MTSEFEYLAAMASEHPVKSRGTGYKITAATIALLLTLVAEGIGESIPHVTAASLNGNPVSLPSDFAGKTAIVIIGFSREGGDQCGPFARKLAKEPSVIDGKAVLYQIAMLESAPRLIRPMILHGMRGGIPKTEQSRFLPLFHDEKQWKQAAGFTKAAEGDAYLLVVGPDGTVRFSGHGKYSDDFYGEFKQHLP